MCDYKEAKEKFYTLLNEQTLWDRASFVTWLEKKLAQYKLSGKVSGQLVGEGDVTRAGFLTLVSNMSGKYRPKFFVWLDMKLAQCRVLGDFQPDESDQLEKGYYPEWMTSSLRNTAPCSLRGFHLPAQLPKPTVGTYSKILPEEQSEQEEDEKMEEVSLQVPVGEGGSKSVVTFRRSSEKADVGVDEVLMQLSDGTWIKGAVRIKQEAPQVRRESVRPVPAVVPKAAVEGAHAAAADANEDVEKKRLYARMHRIKMTQDPARYCDYLERKRQHNKRTWELLKADPVKYRAYLENKRNYKKVWKAKRKEEGRPVMYPKMSKDQRQRKNQRSKQRRQEIKADPTRYEAYRGKAREADKKHKEKTITLREGNFSVKEEGGETDENMEEAEDFVGEISVNVIEGEGEQIGDSSRGGIAEEDVKVVLSRLDSGDGVGTEKGSSGKNVG